MIHFHGVQYIYQNHPEATISLKAEGEIALCINVKSLDGETIMAFVTLSTIFSQVERFSCVPGLN